MSQTITRWPPRARSYCRGTARCCSRVSSCPIPSTGKRSADDRALTLRGRGHRLVVPLPLAHPLVHRLHHLRAAEEEAAPIRTGRAAFDFHHGERCGGHAAEEVGEHP